MFVKNNATHFNIKASCNKDCSTCRHIQSTEYSCIKFPGAPISVKHSIGKIPEIKKYGFIAKIHTSRTCDSPIGITSFVTDKICFSQSSNILGFASKVKKGTSMSTFFNNELQQAETMVYDAEGCVGNVTRKEVYPVGKCIAVGPDGSQFISVEKP
jgi:hypothetical protein